MNWGYKIIVVIVVFIIAMVSMVAVAYKQENQMVETNYYDKEMNYQSLIDASENLNKVSNDTMLSQVEDRLLLKIPISLISGFEKGQIEFLKSADEKKDLVLPFTPDKDGNFFIEQTSGLKGKYKARIRWSNASKTYYREQDITVK